MGWTHGPIQLRSESVTAALAAQIAPALSGGDVILLSGPIGAGKSHFARSALRAMGVTEDIPSPTFTLVQEYDLPGKSVWHVDLYRTTNAQDVIELGLLEAFETAICFVEWPDRLGSLAPQSALSLELSAGAAAHSITFSSNTPDWQHRLKNLPNE